LSEIFVDSNVFLRFYAEDDKTQGEAAEKLFRLAAQHKLELIAGPPVFFEVAWTLRAWFKWPNDKVLDVLEAMTAIPNMTLLDKEVVIKAILLAKNTGQEFADAYIGATVQSRDAQIATFNKKHFAKLGTSLYPIE
jgi:predicted nucleic acid-binding protein